MYLGIALIVVSLIYSLLISIVYYSKKRANIQETRVYDALVTINIINLIMELLCCYTVYNMETMPFINEIICRLFLFTIFLWQTFFTVYIYIVSFKKNPTDKLDFKKKIGKFAIFMWTIMILGLTFLPLEYYNKDKVVYSYGASTNFLYIIVIIYLITWIICYIKKQNIGRKNKYLPILMFIFVMGIALVIRAINPGILIISTSFAFVTNLMYFTIENPDHKLIEEIQLAKKYSDDSNNEKSLFLFNMTQDIRMPITNINKCINNIYKLDNKEEIKKQVREIDSHALELYNIVNGVLDISNVDVKDIKVIDNKYNIKNLLKEVITINKPKIEEKKLEFRFNIDKSLPEYLYGDSIKIKQILNELIENATKYTSNGFVSLNVTSVVKMDVCRLIIYVEDSGIGIEADRISKIFNSNDDDLTDDKLTLSEIQKMLNVIGGTIILNSEYNQGSKITIVLDQKIDNETKSKEQEIIDKYKELIIENKKVLLVDDNESSIKMFIKLSNNFNVNLEYVNTGKECLDKIRNKEKYDLILIDEEMPKLSGYDTIKKLKNINNFNTPVVLLTKNSNLEFSEIHINHGFSDLLIKPINKDTLKKIYNKHLNK